jgi:hypothetical protein
MYGDDVSRSLDMQALSFCLTSRTMAHKLPETYYHLNHGELAVDPRHRELLRWRLLSVLRRVLFETNEAHIVTLSNHLVVARKHSMANTAVGLFSFHLRKTLLGTIRNLSNSSHPPPPSPIALLHPPTTTDIPFASMMDLPLPFTLHATENFATCHLRTMTSREFLENGTWAGYYCFSMPRIDNNSLRFDPPMSGIRFRISRHPSQPGTWMMAGDGVDGVGAFVLLGEIDSETGRIVMKKQYQIGVTWAWDWCAVMTPFGIVGSWGRPDYGGWFWLWKTEWVGGDRGPSRQIS